MMTIQKEYSVPLSYPLKRLGDPEQLLFFDIETTGFSGDYARLYLIGCTYISNGRWQLIQWFADTDDSEKEVLTAFFQFLRRFSVLVHFNGDGFDLPFLLKRCAAHGLPYSFDGVTSLDIYRRIRPYRKLLNLEHMKQKNIEAVLGILREDVYTGSQLIEVYQEYLATRNDFLCHLLLLHNEDDLKGMPAILPILHYPDFLDSPFSFCSAQLQKQEDIFGRTEQLLTLTYQTPISVPVPTETEGPWFSLSLSENRLMFTVPIRKGELKHYYEDYQNYFYLIYEDNAIHKSVGQYVDKGAKKKATARTCYTRTNGLFLPQPSPIWTPCLKEDYRSKQLYTPYCEVMFDDRKKTVQYGKELLHLLFQ